MTISSSQVIRWAPRVAGLGLAIFLSLFATTALTEDRGLAGTIVAFAMGLLPALVVAAVVIIGWTHDGAAAILFSLLTIFYAVSTLERPLWIAIVAGPLAVTGGLFFLSWMTRTRNHVAIGQAPRLPGH